MRLPLLALLCAGSTAFCQSPAQPKVDPDKLFQMPEKFSQTPESEKPPAVSEKLRLPLPVPHIVLLSPDPGMNHEIDPKIIIRPPWPRKGDEPRGQDISRNLYPNLKFLPIHRGAQNRK
jgi:hypothetical protein